MLRAWEAMRLGKDAQIAALVERCKRHEEEAGEKARTVDALRRKLSAVARSTTSTATHSTAAAAAPLAGEPAATAATSSAASHPPVQTAGGIKPLPQHDASDAKRTGRRYALSATHTAGDGGDAAVAAGRRQVPARYAAALESPQHSHVSSASSSGGMPPWHYQHGSTAAAASAAASASASSVRRALY